MILLKEVIADYYYFFFFKEIKEDRFLFYCFVCAQHKTRMPP